MTRTVAFFDFDGTLVKGDSLLPFLGFTVGWPKLVREFTRALMRPEAGHPDKRTAIKATLLAHTLKGVPVTQAKAAAQKLAPLRHWKQPAQGALMRLKQDGALIVVATGALDLYIDRLLEGLPVDKIIATDMESANGILTGRMAGGNCVRAEKARRVAAFIKTHGPFDEIHGYGNAPHDLAMLDLCDFKTII
jgi:phosphatidylglycerophosphatase C